MKTEQITLALAVARDNSVSKAAESLFISQPTASNWLKQLETEIGYHIFRRKRDGVLLTDEGKAFLEQALKIEQALHSISKIGQNIGQIDFRVYSIYLDFSALAFEALCEQYHSDGHAGQMLFRYTQSTDEAARIVAKGDADTAIILCAKGLYNHFLQKLNQMSLEVMLLCVYPMMLTCKKDHPIIRDGVVHYDLLKEYPGFSGISRFSLEPNVSFYDARIVGQTQTTYIMDPSPMRYRLLHKTNGFLFSLPVPGEIIEAYDLTSVTLENHDIAVFAIFRNDSSKEQMIHDYLRLCKDFCGNNRIKEEI